MAKRLADSRTSPLLGAVARGRSGSHRRQRARFGSCIRPVRRLLRLYLTGDQEMPDFQHEQDRIAAETQALKQRVEPEPGLELAPKVVERAFAIIDRSAQAYLHADERERGMWNEAVFSGIWVGDREIKRTE